VFFIPTDSSNSLLAGLRLVNSITALIALNLKAGLEFAKSLPPNKKGLVKPFFIVRMAVAASFSNIFLTCAHKQQAQALLLYGKNCTNQSKKPLYRKTVGR